MVTFAKPKRTTIWAHPSNYTRGRIKRIRCIVWHDMEASEGNGTAEVIGSLFARKGFGGSTHVGTDPDSICRYLPDTDTPWGAQGVNADGLHIEQAGYANQTAAQWTDDASLRIIENSSIIAAEWSEQYGIPARWLTDAQIRDGVSRGHLTHRDATRAFATYGGHTDPGPNFPRGYAMDRVAAHLAGHPDNTKDWYDMPIPAADLDAIAAKVVDKLLAADRVPPPNPSKDNPTWSVLAALQYTLAAAVQSRDGVAKVPAALLAAQLHNPVTGKPARIADYVVSVNREAYMTRLGVQALAAALGPEAAQLVADAMAGAVAKPAAE